MTIECDFFFFHIQRGFKKKKKKKNKTCILQYHLQASTPQTRALNIQSYADRHTHMHTCKHTPCTAKYAYIHTRISPPQRHTHTRIINGGGESPSAKER